MADHCKEEEDHHEYIFGFGSIINPSTHAPWLTNKGGGENGTTVTASAATKQQNHSNSSSDATTSTRNDTNNNSLPGVPATILAKFGYQRGWNFRSNTGFTALGISRSTSSSANTGSSGNKNGCGGGGADINGVLFQIGHDMLPDFDRREVGYDRLPIPVDCLRLDTQYSSSSSSSLTLSLTSLSPKMRIWVYIPQNCLPADEDHPILQSYVDTVMQGCLFWGHEAMAEDFVRTTNLWSPYFLNDTPSSRRPWLYRQQYTVIDKILQRNSTITHISDRRHPEEFAIRMKSMRGLWAVPRRNAIFIGRDKEIDQIHARLLAQKRDVNSSVAKLEVCGMGGVGKTQICTEYCYRYFPSYYGLVIWLRAPSAESVAAGYRQLMADTSGGGGTEGLFQDKDTDEIVAEVKARLFRSTVPWLLVFDNLEDHSLLDKFVPNGGTAGHVLVTTRLIRTDTTVDEDQRMILGCFSPQESIDLLSRAAGEHNISTRSSKQIKAAEELAVHLGHLPLALGMAAAYMRKCDVDCPEYLNRYYAQNTISTGHHLGHEAVSSSLSLSLQAIQTESPVAWDALRLLGWLGPDQITKKFLRSLFVSKNKYDREEEAREARLVYEAEKHQAAQLWVARTAVGLTSGALLLAFLSTGRRQGKSRTLLSLGTAVFSVSAAFAYHRRLGNLPTDVQRSKEMKSQTQVRRSSSFPSNVFEQTDMTWTTLKSFSLLTVKKGNGSMHRLLAQALRVEQQDDEKRYSLDICLQTVLDVWTFKAEQADSWQDSTPVLEHVKTVLAHIVEQKQWRLTAAILAREAGVFSAMALNRFEEARGSLEQSLGILNGLESSSFTTSTDILSARAAAHHELGRVLRYEAQFGQAENELKKALQIRKSLAEKDLDRRHGVATTLHELGVLEVRKHNLDSAATFLQQSLDLRRTLERELSVEGMEADCASTLHQLATVKVARKPPCLDEAESLLTEALGLNMQIGQRAATLKQLARVAIRRGNFDVAESRLSQALELYVELYGDSTLHINVAAVKFQQGTLAYQREQYDEAWEHFTDCLRARRHVYAYSQGNHLEVSTVLHELGCVAFAQKRVDVACEMLTSEKKILDQLYVTSGSQHQRLSQALLTNLTWLRKCAKEQGDEEKVRQLVAERTNLKRNERQQKKTASEGIPCQALQNEALRCRLVARRYALAVETSTRESVGKELEEGLKVLAVAVENSAACEMHTAVLYFHNKVCDAQETLDSKEESKAILEACDRLRDRLRDHGVQVQDITHRANRDR